MAVSSSKRDQILRDYRNKVVTSAAGLAKKYEISRSSVYRILSDEAKPATGSEKSAAVPEGPKLVIEEADDKESVASAVSNSFYRRSDRFADDLGLTTSTLKNASDDKVDPEVNAAQLESVMERMFSDSPVQVSGEIRGIPDFTADLPSRAPGTVGQEAKRSIVPSEVIDRDDVTQRIIFVVEHFGPVVVGIVGPDSAAFLQRLSEKSDVELVRCLRTLERTRSVGNIAAGFKQLFYFTSAATETMTKVVGLRTDGFSERLREQDQEITMIMKEIALNQWERVKALDSPEMRLGSMFCLTLLQTDAMNRMKQSVRSSVPASVVNAHADL